MKPREVLIVCTGHDRMGDTGRRTGIWLEEFAAPCCIWQDAGFSVTVASPEGGRVPIDPNSLRTEALSAYTRRIGLDSPLLFRSEPLAGVAGREWDLVFFPGGHGPLWDLAVSPEVAALLRRHFGAGRVTAAVCHGPAALCAAPELLRGRKLTAFSEAEEKLVGLDRVVPFALESRLRECGAQYECRAPWSSFVVAEGPLVTGQNPQSSEALGKRVLELFP